MIIFVREFICSMSTYYFATNFALVADKQTDKHIWVDILESYADQGYDTMCGEGIFVC